MSKRNLGAICLMLAIAAPLSAQRGPGQARRGGDRPERGGVQARGHRGPAQLLALTQTLELSDEQVTQLTSAQEGFAEQRAVRVEQARELRQQARSGDLSRNEIREITQSHREAGREISTAHQATIDQILNEEQHSKLQELRQAGRQAGGKGRIGRQAGRQGRMSRQAGRRGRQGVRSGRGGPPRSSFRGRAGFGRRIGG